MAEGTNVMYIVVLDNGGKLGNGNESFRYTRQILQSTLQLMGCKPRHAFKISKRVFVLTRNEISGDILLPEILGKSENNNQKKNIPSRLYKRRTTAFVRRDNFLDIVCDALAEYKYVGPNQRTDLILACRIRERKESVTVLLCGTSGCGKSTLSALLGSRLGITTVISTDSIRHMMRSFVDEKENPLLWASTYHAGEFLDPVAVAEARARKQAKKSAGGPLSNSKDLTENSDKSDFIPSAMSSTPTELLSPKQMAIKGYKAQSEMVIESLDRLITLWEERNESVIVEGVHLSLNFVMGLMKKHPSIIPFMVYIANEDKHLERFAVRAKYMTLDPAKNKYVKYIRNIRTIQEYLCNRADKHLVPKINNTNVDKSVASIHATVFSCLRRRKAGELYDPIRNTVTIVDEEYRNQLVANSLGSKGMFQLIQRKGSSRNLMALVNTDGSVAKAWPVNSIDSNGKPIRGHGSENDVGNPMYGPLEIGKAEIVNIPFGLYGISAWPSDGGTSQAGSIDDSRVDGTDTGSRNPSSCCSSPRLSDGPFKELKEEHSVYGSDEEIEEPPETGSDEDLSDAKTVQDEVGSLDEESTKTDEEYDDLALQDVHENGYGSDDDEESKRKLGSFYGKKGTECHNQGIEHSQNLDLFYRTKSEPPSELLCSFSSLLMEKNDKVHSPPRNLKMRRRSLSIPALSKRAVTSDPVLSGAHRR